MRSRIAGRLAPLAALSFIVAACGTATGPATSGDPDGTPAEPPYDGGLLRAWATVLDDGNGPQLCVGAVAESYPPQCSGPPLVGWEWPADTATTAGGTTWGGYVVTGRYDGERFTVSEPPVPLEEYDGPPPPVPPEHDLSTPCPEPAGGWRPVDPDRTTEATLEQVARRANALPGFADLWWDQSVNPASDDQDDASKEQAMNDPARLVVNVRVTGDPAEAEAELREVWGGALCVTKAQRTERELMRIQHELRDLQGLLYSSSGRDVVHVTVVHDDGTLQRSLDDTYGEGAVRVTSALVPVSDQHSTEIDPALNGD